MEGTGKEAGHLLARHATVRAEEVWGTADGDAVVVGPGDVTREDRVTDVVDACAAAGLDGHGAAGSAEPHASPRALVRLLELREEAVRIDRGTDRVPPCRHVRDVDPL